MLKYARFQLDGKDSSGNTLLSNEALAFAHAPAVDAPTGGFTGLTWFVRNYGEVSSAYHGGTYIGYRTLLQLVPDHDQWRQVSACPVVQTDEAGSGSRPRRCGQHIRRVADRHRRPEQGSPR